MNALDLEHNAHLTARQWQTHRNSIHTRQTAARALRENVAALPSIDSVSAVTLQPINHEIPNVAGKQASVAIYSHLASKYGGKLTAEAAAEGLQLYDETVADAKAHRGSHPNIDILLDVVKDGNQLTIEIAHVQ